MTIWIVKGEDCEPKAFSTMEKAYNFIQKDMVQHGKDYRYNDDEMAECLNQLNRTFSYCANGSADWFGTCLLDYDLDAYLTVIDEFAEEV